MASGIYIKPSKRGTFTAAAKKHGKGVQAFASQVLANKGNYSPAMVKKANFARNAAGWQHEKGGPLIAMFEEGGGLPRTPVLMMPLIQQKAQAGDSIVGGKSGVTGKEVQGYNREQLKLGVEVEREHTDDPMVAIEIAMDHLEEDPEYYTSIPGDADKSAQKGAAKEGVQFKKKSPQTYEYGGLLLDEYGFGSWIKENGAGLLKGAGSIVSMIPGFGQIAGPILSVAGSVVGNEQQKNAMKEAELERGRERLNNYLPSRGRVTRETRTAPFESKYGIGGDLLGGVMNAIGGLGGGTGGGGGNGLGIASQLIGAVGNVIGGVQQNNMAQDQAEQQQKMLDEQSAAQERELQLANIEARRQNFVDENQIDYGPSFMAYGGGIPQITEYKNGDLHSEGMGGIPVDAKGNPATTSRKSAVGMTERGEITWNGYVFSDKLEI